MTSPFAAHRAASAALFSLFCLLAIVFAAGDPRLFAALAGASLVSAFLTTRRFAAGLGSFGSPLAILVDQALLWTAIAPEGGGQSLFALLLPAGVALTWQLEGKAAARFYAVVSVAGSAAMIAGRALPASGTAQLALLLAAVAAPALLVALEASADGRKAAAAAPRRTESARAEAPARTPVAVDVEADPEPPSRRAEEAILHDLKSPLSVLRVYADLISEGARRGELPNSEHLSNLAREIDLAEKLVAEASAPASGAAASGTGAGPSSAAESNASADLVEILGSLATAYRLSLGGRRRIEFIAERPELVVAADPVALQRAFRNVLENAVKYTPEGGEIRVRAGPAGPHAFVVFKDTGIGMSDEERTHAFDYAFRGAGAITAGTRGKGIGLAVTKQILEANGGRISLSSEAGFGSEVTILLPFARGAR